MQKMRSIRKRKNDLKQIRTILKRNGTRCHEEARWFFSIIEKYPLEVWLLSRQLNTHYLSAIIQNNLEKSRVITNVNLN